MNEFKKRNKKSKKKVSASGVHVIILGTHSGYCLVGLNCGDISGDKLYITESITIILVVYNIIIFQA